MEFLRINMAIKKINFTAPKIQTLICEAGKSQSIYWDARTPNFGVRVTQGASKSYIFETWFNGKSLRITIGDTKSWALNEAQAEARRLKVLTDQGIDPREKKAEIKAQAIAKKVKGTLALVVWDEYIKARTKQWGERHKADHEEMARLGGEKITRGLRPGQPKVKQPGILYELLSVPLEQIDRDRVAAWVKKESKDRPARTRLALAMLKAFLNWASDTPKFRALVNAGACDRLTKELPPKQSKDDCLEREQLKLWFEGVKQINNPVFSAYLQMLLLTGARRNELTGLKWADLDTQWHKATIRDKVEGTRIIPLTPYIELLLINLPRRNEFVFSSNAAKGRHITEPRIPHNQALETGGLPPLTLHGLRRSFSTLADEVECPAGVTAQIMGHKPSAIAEKHYKRRSISVLRGWLMQIENFMLTEAGIPVPKFEESNKRLKLVNSD
jgi:integrase